MESLLGSLRVLIPASTVHSSEESRNLPQTASLRSVQVSACRSSPSQLKTSAVASISTEEPKESSSVNGQFNPLPLPSSWSAVPTPLKFLWFNKDSTETRDQDLLIPGPSQDGEEIGASCDGEEEGAGNEACSTLTEESGPVLQGKDCKSESVTGILDSSMPSRQERSWIPKIADIRAFWPDPKDIRKETMVTDEASPEVQSGPWSPLDTALEADRGSSDSSKSKSNDVACTLGCSWEVPYMKVLHTKGSFSKFLQDASLYDMKVFAQLSFLCDMAYMIPNIQPGQLLKYHHLRFITSSLEKKAEIETKAKETGEMSKKLDTRGRGERGENLNCGNGGSMSTPQQPSKAVVINTAQIWKTEEAMDQSLEENVSLHKDSLKAIAPASAVAIAEEETKLATLSDQQPSRSCPCEWFVCDEPSTKTRILVIQGSGSLASWQANLFFEPTSFEGLDVSVHRGIYEAANALFDEVLPEVLAHLSRHGEVSQLRFTGHSLGGSLATLLALMFQIRGVLPSSTVLPVVTFGSPCIMCGGDFLLQKMDLPKNHIQSVIMHRDVVPRAFSCDYPDHVAEVLKRLSGRFRGHPCLNNQKLLYAPMGQFYILQPEESAAPAHPLLPDGHGLYVLRHPIHDDSVESAIELRGAQRSFLNLPHPLDILSDPGAYGFDGAVSRDHDPRSYTKAIHVAVKHELRRLRRVQREQRRQLWWPLAIADSSLFLQKGGVSFEQSSTLNAGGTTCVFGQPKNFVNATCKHISFSVPYVSVWEWHKKSPSRYAGLIASRHLQMGILLVCSLRIAILEYLSTLFVWI